MEAILSRPQCLNMQCIVWLLTTVFYSESVGILCMTNRFGFDFMFYCILNTKTAQIVKILPDRGQEHVYPTMFYPTIVADDLAMS